MKRVIYETITEALSDEDKRAVLDIEADIVDLKQQLIDADDVEKEDINQRIADLKDEMEAIKQVEESTNRKVNLLRENYNIKYYGKNNWAPYIKRYIKVLIDTLLEDMTNKVPRSIMIHTAVRGNFAGAYVRVDRKAIEDLKFHVYVRDSYSLTDVADMLSHELVHIKQILEGELDIEPGYFLWKGERFPIADYNAGMIGQGESSYRDVPWEVDAYDNQENYFRQWMGSRERKQLERELEEHFLSNYMKDFLEQHGIEKIQSSVSIATFNNVMLKIQHSLEKVEKLWDKIEDERDYGEFDAERWINMLKRHSPTLGITDTHRDIMIQNIRNLQ